MRILIADPDRCARESMELLFQYLHDDVVEAVECAEEAEHLLATCEFDIAIVDMDDEEGGPLGFLRSIRSQGNKTPVIVISGIGSANNSIKALEAGADDVLTKPFDGGELRARATAVVRRLSGFSTSALSLGPLSIDTNLRQVFVRGVSLHLTAKEYGIIELMVRRQGLVLTKEAILTNLYQERDEPELKIIDVFVCKLRKKLKAAGLDGVLQTVWGRGYMLKLPEAIAA